MEGVPRPTEMSAGSRLSPSEPPVPRWVRDALERRMAEHRTLTDLAAVDVLGGAAVGLDLTSEAEEDERGAGVRRHHSESRRRRADEGTEARAGGKLDGEPRLASGRDGD